MLDQLLKMPKTLLAKFQKLPQLQQLAIAGVVLVAGYWLWKNVISKRMENFGGAASGAASSGGADSTLSCTMYYTEWCPHCKTAKPHWAKLMQALNGKKVGGKKVLITAVDCEKYPEIAKAQNIGGYPSFKFNMDGRQMEYDGERNYEGWKSFIEKIAYSDFQ